MSGEAPKRRLRKRPTTEEELIPRFSKEPEASVLVPVESSEHNAGQSNVAPEVVSEAATGIASDEPPRELTNRLSPRLEGTSNHQTPRADISVPNSARNQPTEPSIVNSVANPPVQNIDQELHITPTERDSLVTAGQNEEPATPVNRSRGFHFRRGRKGADEPSEIATPNEQHNNNVPIVAEGNRGIRPMPRYAQSSMFDFLLQSNLHCGMGYDVNKFHRHGRFEEVHPGLRLEAEADGLGVGVTVLKVNSYGVQMIGIVKPLVKIHAVSINTGYYIKSRNFPAVVPITTHPCALIDATTNPTWNEELILNAYFSDIVSEDTLLLFEILDDKPSLRTNYSSSSSSAESVPIAKRVAWGYLLPIGMSGEMNVGFSDDWKYTTRRAQDRKNRQASRDKNRTRDRFNEDNEDDHDQDAHSSNRSLAGAGPGTSDEPDHAERNGPTRASSHKSEESQEESGDEGNGSPQRRHRYYPWDKPSVDKLLRIQLHSYRQYDGVFGMIQRKIKGWPTIASYSDK